MKVLKIVLKTLKWIIIIGIILFALATFIGRNYGQTIVLIAVGFLLALYYPDIEIEILDSGHLIVIEE